MPLLNNKITRELESLCRLSSSDFSALAIMQSYEPRVRWKYAFGNRSERYKRMTLKPGAGPAGLALRIGKPVNWDDRVPPNPGFRTECPLMAAEQLRSAAAFPILKENRIEAVLLIARRSTLSYTDSEMTAIQDTLHTLVPLIHKKE